MTPFQSKVLMLARMGHIEPQFVTNQDFLVKWMLGRINVTATIARLVSGGHLKVIRPNSISNRLPRLE
jgi:hypothetical protein